MSYGGGVKSARRRLSSGATPADDRARATLSPPSLTLSGALASPTPKISIQNRHEAIALSFNGGKDSTVILHLLRLALFAGDEEEEEGEGGGGDEEQAREQPTRRRRPGLRGVRSFYFDTSAPAQAAAALAEDAKVPDGGSVVPAAADAASAQQTPGDFCEVAAFVRATDAAYALGVDYLADRDFKGGLGRYCRGGAGGAEEAKGPERGLSGAPPRPLPPIAAILLGTRRGDPNADGQDHFCPSSRGWPPFMRLNPVLDWGYADVWRFLRLGGLPHCSLYDRGYTSLGSPATTLPNAALRRADGTFAPAHELADGRLERQGRRPPGAPAPYAAAAAAAGAAAAVAATTAAAAPASSAVGAGGEVSASFSNPPQPQVSLPRLSCRYAVVVLVGDELLSGRVRDANGSYLCGELRAMGWAVRRLVIVPDDVESVAMAVAAASRDADAVITSGGVGPTRDDVTMAGIAGAVGGGGGRLTRHPEAERALIQYFGAEKVTEAHLKMADVPGSGDVELIWTVADGDEEEAPAAAGDGSSAAGAPARRSPFPLLRVGNVYVLPGVPSLFRRKWAVVHKRLAAMDRPSPSSPPAAAASAPIARAPSDQLLPFRSATLRLNAPDEAAVAPCLDTLADERGAGVMIGSYPVDVWEAGGSSAGVGAGGVGRGGGGEQADGATLAGGAGGAAAAAAAASAGEGARTTTLRVVLESKDAAGLDAAVERLTELLRTRLGDGVLLGVERSGD